MNQILIATVVALIIGFVSSVNALETPDNSSASNAAVDSAKLHEALVDTVWIYHWNQEDFEFGFGKAGELQLLSSWKDARWLAISANDVLFYLPGSNKVMTLTFDENIQSFQTSDWGGKSARGTRKVTRLHNVNFTVSDIFNRDVISKGITLVDWEGYISNPAIKIKITPPNNAAFPAKALLTANGARLYFDEPCTVGKDGPSKQITFANATSTVIVLLSIYPDEDGLDENYTLTLKLDDVTTRVPIHVIDQDTTLNPPNFKVTIDFSHDKNGFFNDITKRELVQKQADDWAYYIDGTNLAPVAVGAESTWIPGPNSRENSINVTNKIAFTGFLLYATGVESNEKISGSSASNDGFQYIGNVIQKYRRSGTYCAEVTGNFNQLGWKFSSSDDDWHESNNREGATDLKSVAHHEIGHAMFFHPSHTLFAVAAKNGGLENPAILAYHGSALPIDKNSHFDGVIDDASKKGAFGFEHNGSVPARRWTITKIDLLALQAVGYKLRATSPFAPLALSSNFPPALPGQSYSTSLGAVGGVPSYDFEVTDGFLPADLTLDSFTGAITGTAPTTPGDYTFTVRVRDQVENGTWVSQKVRITVGNRKDSR